MEQMSIYRFEAQCLSILDEVAESGSELVITKGGRPVARVVPVVEIAPLAGSVEQLVSDDELVEPIARGTRW